MLAATEKVAEVMVAARDNFWRSVIGVPPAGRAVRSNVAVTPEGQNYSIVVAVKNAKGCSAARGGACNPSWVMCGVGTECHCRIAAACRQGVRRAGCLQPACPWGQ